MSVRIGLTGDVMLGRLVDRRQRNRRPEAVWGTMFERLTACDGVLINLESCLSTRGEPWTKTHRPFHFRADPGWGLPALDRAGVVGCALANNHALDFGTVALSDTLEGLESAGIATVGAGQTRALACAPGLVGIGDLQVGWLAFTDNTPEYAATKNALGTAHIQIDVGDEGTRSIVRNALDRTHELDPDLVVVSLHWGPNMTARPPDEFTRFAHWLIESGVDVIHGHSAHVFHGIEVYQGRPILYDTGDFVDDYAVEPRLRNDRSFLFELEVTPGGTPATIRLHPTEIFDCAVHAAALETVQWSHQRMRDRSREFGTRFSTDGEILVLPLEV